VPELSSFFNRYKQEKSIEAELLKLRRVQKSVETDDHLMVRLIGIAV
jgi:hypothetical protein